MKRLFLFICWFFCALLIFSYDFKVGNLCYKILSETEKTVEVTKDYYPYVGIMAIPEKVVYNSKEYSVVSIGSYAFEDLQGWKTIEIPASVTSIGSYAFDGCTGINYFDISSNVTEIGNSAFRGCKDLETINVAPENPNYSSIDGVLFDKKQTLLMGCPCATIGEYTVPSTVLEIDIDSFRGCKELTNIILPNGLIKIDMLAFYDCENLTSLNIPASVKEISSNAFCECDNLVNINVDEDNEFYTSVNGCLLSKDKTVLIFGTVSESSNLRIPDSVKKISSESVCNKNIVSIEIPASVNAIEGMPFRGCENLKSITVDKENPYFCSFDGILYNKEGTKLLVCPGGFEGDFVIPEYVTSIGSYAFAECEKMTSVTIPNSIKSLGTGAFGICNGLTSIEIPEDVKNIPINSFSMCANLKTVKFNGKVSVSMWAFDKCKNLQNINSENIIGISASSFRDCKSLTSFTFNENLEYLENYAFEGCYKLDTIYANMKYLTPFTNEQIFLSYNYDALLYVQPGMKNKYMNTKPWSNFKNIVELAKVEWNTPANGTMTIHSNGKKLESGIRLTTGTEINVNAVPEEGYEVESVSAGDAEVEFADGLYMFPVTDDTVIEVIFKAVEQSAVNSVKENKVYYDSWSKMLHVNGANIVKVYNVDGIEILNSRNGQDINVSGFAKGLYVADVDGVMVKFRV